MGLLCSLKEKSGASLDKGRVIIRREVAAGLLLIKFLSRITSCRLDIHPLSTGQSSALPFPMHEGGCRWKDEGGGKLVGCVDPGPTPACHLLLTGRP